MMRKIVYIVVAVIILVISVRLAASEDGQSEEGRFLQEPQNVNLSANTSAPVELLCIYNQPVISCRWWKQDTLFYPSSNVGVVYTGNVSEGDCSIVIRRPEVGRHTTLWQCTVKTLKYKNVVSRPARLVVKNFPRYHKHDKDSEYSMMYVDSSPFHANVHLEIKTPYQTRIRWFVNGERTSDFSEVNVDLVDPLKNRVNSTVNVHFSNKSYPLLMVHASVEYLTNYMSNKKYEIFEIFLITDGFNYSIFNASDGKGWKPPMEVISPQPILYLNNKTVTKRWMTIPVDYPNLNEFYFFCEDAVAFPTSLLNWKVQFRDTEVTSGFEEFNTSYEASAETEFISLMALLRHSDSFVTVTCNARNVFSPFFKMNFKTVTIYTRYVTPKCAERIAAASRATSFLSGLQMPLLTDRILLLFYLCKFSLELLRIAGLEPTK